jgi:hypothetical protein
MALTNYDELVKAIETWGHRDDLNVLIPDFIKLTEVAMYNNSREPLAIRDMESIQTTTTDTGKYIALPDNYESARSVRLSTVYGEIRYRAPEQLTRLRDTGQPRFFTIIGNEIELDRTPDDEYTLEMQVYVRPDAISADNQTNSVLTNYPNIYLYGALTQFFAHAQDDQQAAKYESAFVGAIQGANKAQKKGRYGPAPSMGLDCGMIV